MSTTTRRARIPWPADPDAHRRCGECDRCRTGIGRDQNPDASDCWDAYLEAAASTRRPA